jgi:ABC-type multidrug transport system fused ATPase/permease subunit
MGKYALYQRKSVKKRGMNPIWRGIGCLLIVIVLLVSFGLMEVSTPAIIATGKVPYQLLGHIHFPDWAFKFKMTADIASFISGFDNLWMYIITFFVMLLLLTGVASLLYSIIYTLIGPARYSAQDAPPPKYKAKKYTR